MKKIAIIITMVVMAAIVSGFSVNADQNTDLTYPILNKINEEDNQPYRFEIEELVEDLEIPEDEMLEASSVDSGGASWIYAKTQDGASGSKTTLFELLYNRNDDLLSKIEIPEASEIVEAQPTIYEGGKKAQADAFFDADKLSAYGTVATDESSAGVELGQNSVRQQDGTWDEGIQYEGYYIVAASSSIPLFSTIEVSDHSMSGMGIEEGVPFKAIVLDRNGAIKGSEIDLFVGNESNASISQGEVKDAKVKILSVDNNNLAPVVEEAPVVESPKKVEATPSVAPAASNSVASDPSVTEKVQSTSASSSSSFLSSRVTRYGVDCYGCNIDGNGRGATASGVGVGIDEVRQKDGTWQKGITYEGYYVVATESDLPFYSIIEITNHSFSGMGLQPGVPFKAIVLDRGGDITDTKIDLFVGRETNMPVSQGSQQGMQVNIISTN